MKKVFLVLLIVFSIISHSQERENNYFVLNKGGEKYLKPIKYIMFNGKKDKKSVHNLGTYFYIEDNRFFFSKKNHKIDTCNIKHLNKIKFTEVSNLKKEAYNFYIETLKEDNYWKDKTKKHPMPLKINSYVKIVLVSIEDNNLLKYDVFWK